MEKSGKTLEKKFNGVPGLSLFKISWSLYPYGVNWFCLIWSFVVYSLEAGNYPLLLQIGAFVKILCFKIVSNVQVQIVLNFLKAAIQPIPIPMDRKNST